MRKNARLFGDTETPFERPSWPVEYVNVNSKYAYRKPTWDIIF